MKVLFAALVLLLVIYSCSTTNVVPEKREYQVTKTADSWAIGIQKRDDFVFQDGKKDTLWYLLDSLDRADWDTTSLATVELLFDNDRLREIVLFKDLRGQIIHMALFDQRLEAPLFVVP